MYISAKFTFQADGPERDVAPPVVRRDPGVGRVPRRRVLLHAEPVRQRHEAQAGALHRGTEGEGCHPQTGILAGT